MLLSAGVFKGNNVHICFSIVTRFLTSSTFLHMHVHASRKNATDSALSSPYFE